jgi:hypothetical protein
MLSERQAIIVYYQLSKVTICHMFIVVGMKYVTDKAYRNCTVTQIGDFDFGANMSPNQSVNSTYKLFIKDPLQLFLIDDSYFFVGQVS